jgi:hypothetical protein
MSKVQDLANKYENYQSIFRQGDSNLPIHVHPQREPRNDNNSNPPQNSGDDKDMML